MKIVEVEVPIKGEKLEIEKMLLSQNFMIFYKVLTISDYYLPINQEIDNHKTLKERSKRLRYVVPISKFINEFNNYKEWVKKYDLDECKREEQKILDKGYKKIYTDIKTDFVYKNLEEDTMFFQIQDIKNDCLIIAYDNKKYYDYEEKEQKELLIRDIESYGIDIIDKNNIDRFKLIGNIKSIKEIIDIINEQIKLL